MALNRIERRRRIHYRIRKHVNGTAERPRMVVFRSNKQIYVQVVNDLEGKTLVAAASNDKVLAAQGQLLTMALGYSHDIQIMLPKEVTAETPQVRKGENPVLILKSADKQLVGQIAAKIRSFRRPEPYKGKGIKFAGETLRRKAGKTASAK